MISRYIKFWFFASLFPSVVISLLSFFIPFDNIEDYEFSYLLEVESLFLLLTFAIFLSLSTIVQSTLYAFVLLISSKFYLIKGKNAYQRWLILWLVSLLAYSVIIFLWLSIGLSINHQYWLYVIPAYVISFTIGIRLILKD